jgi:uncharacterized protein (UPF0333 family)
VTPLQRLVARVLALGGAYFAVSLLERVAAAAEAEAAAARLAAATADDALFQLLTGGLFDADGNAREDLAEDLADLGRGGEGSC